MRGGHAGRGARLSVLLLVAVAAEAQLDPQAVPKPGEPVPYLAYDSPEPADVSDIAYGGQRYHRTSVRTKGLLRTLLNSPYYTLSEGPARVLLIPVPEIEGESRTLIGRRIEITGLARVLPTRQEMKLCYAQYLPESKCEDYQLPALPDARLDWPEVSVTFFSLTDIESSARKGPDPGGLNLAELTESIGKTVHVVGLFGGHNLFGDLPAGSEQGPSDWVLRRGRDAVWVTGKPPQGNGWKLNPSYAADTVHWLEVTGRVEKRGEVTYLRASKVALTGAPTSAKDEP
jgi:hypothetical protein